MSDKKLRPGNSFTYEYKGISRHLITPAKIESAKNKQKNIDINALWDTGAACSLVTRKVALELDLKPISKTFISTPTDKNAPSNVYLVSLYLPNNTIFPSLLVAEGDLNN